MKYLLLFLTLFSGIFAVSAQEEEEEEEQQPGWTTEGIVSLLFNQSAFNELWTGGGTSNLSTNFLVNYDFNYLRDNITWDNKLIVDYGITKQQGNDFARKTSDRLEFNSIAGKQMKESNWFYSLFLNFRTQITKGYRFGTNDQGEATRTENTRFLSPGYLQLGPGVLWKNSEDLYFNIAPATARLVFADPFYTSLPEYVNNSYFGVEEGESVRFEFGASFSGYAQFELVENVMLSNLLNLYSNYLDDPQNVDLDYTFTAKMKINDYLSTNLIFQAIYDDNAVRGFQIREVFGLGFNYEI